MEPDVAPAVPEQSCHLQPFLTHSQAKRGDQQEEALLFLLVWKNQEGPFHPAEINIGVLEQNYMNTNIYIP